MKSATAPRTIPSPPTSTPQALVAAARAGGCDCVHPGYGFLAENADFAEGCAAAGLVFVGPPPAALSLFGDKVRARRLAASLDIPVVPGSDGQVASADDAVALGRRLGYPVMLKAAAGGGGRGMRAVRSAEEMTEAFARCRSEAEAAFGDGAVFAEKLIERPRHIEVQVLADAGGAVVHLHERDCSVQLRNQKVIETAPAPGLDGDLRERLLADAVRLMEAAGYVNAGTVEFLVVPETGERFFIECNARIQVEHTVTEQVTGFDLVEAQFRIAAGAGLGDVGLGDQAEVGEPRGFAVQARVVARGAGTLSAYKEPSGPGVRVDGCGYVGYSPPPQFDPLLAKVTASSSSSFGRGAAAFSAAVDRARRAVSEFHVGGLATNLDQLQAILGHPAVRRRRRADHAAGGEPRTACGRGRGRGRRRGRRGRERRHDAAAAAGDGDGAVGREWRRHAARRHGRRPPNSTSSPASTPSPARWPVPCSRCARGAENGSPPATRCSSSAR